MTTISCNRPETSVSTVAHAETEASAVIRSLKASGYAAIDAATVINLLNRFAPSRVGATLDDFSASWNRLGPDKFMKDGGTYRERSFSTFEARAPGHRLVQTEARPHFQAREHNHLNGGVDRVFMQTEDRVVSMPAMVAITEGFRQISEAVSPRRRWTCAVHQFRIITSTKQTGLPTPEGMHRDGVEWVLIMLIARQNVAGGKTTITRSDGARLEEFTMVEPFSVLLLDDERLRHGVSEIEPVDPTIPAYRDTLVVTLKGLD